MSHHTPATPASTSPACHEPHHSRTAGSVKSGNAQMPGPHHVVELVAVAREAEEAALAALDVDRVLLVDLHARIGDHHHAEAVLAQRGDQAGRIREPLVVPREDPDSRPCSRCRGTARRTGSAARGTPRPPTAPRPRPCTTSATAGCRAPTAAASACGPSAPCSAAARRPASARGSRTPAAPPRPRPSRARDRPSRGRARPVPGGRRTPRARDPRAGRARTGSTCRGC